VPDTDASGVLTLERLLELVVDCGRPLDVAVETKHPTRYSGLVERSVIQMLDRFALTGRRARDRGGDVPRSRVMSFSALALRRIQALAPQLPTVYLMKHVPARRRSGHLPPGTSAAGPSIDALRADPGYPKRAHRHGHEVHVWTVDTPQDVLLCRETGVDTIITNRPDEVMTLLGRTPAARGE
jgi:glycerophosphoryl diester phosphodiesterase